MTTLREPEPFHYDADAEFGPLAGRRMEHGFYVDHPQAGPAVQFRPVRVNGKEVNPIIRLAGKPKLAAAWAAHEKARGEYEAAVAANLPGLEELRAAQEREERHGRRFARMMDDEHNDGARPPRREAGPAFADLAAKHPRARLYLRAESYSFAANDQKAAAGKEAMEILEHGGSEADAARVLENWLPQSAFNN